MNISILLFTLGPWEIIAIVFVVILLFGAKRIPELAKGIGKGIREFKDASKEEQKEKRKEETKD
jgi:sec-independent protein translocase protein TatA